MRTKGITHPPPDLDSLSNRVQYVMHLRGIGFLELDRALGKKHSGYTSRLISGSRSPRAANIGKLSQALNVPADWLLSGGPVPVSVSATPAAGDAVPRAPDSPARWATVTRIYDGSVRLSQAFAVFYLSEGEARTLLADLAAVLPSKGGGR